MSNIWANLLTILVGGLLVNNFVMNRFLGCCPFLGVSKQYDTAKGMSMAVIFVMALASFITWFVQHLILVRCTWNTCRRLRSSSSLPCWSALWKWR